MDYETQERLCRRGDSSPDAIHARLVAAREATGLTAKALAEASGIKYTTFKSQEAAGSPSVKLMRFYLARFQIDFNFVLGGDPSRIPADTLRAILGQLASHDKP
ncbi:XRE family transcriptional regulator [uncultured Maritimibacter sp.]|jgi:transcriptional regulator with XRE-family HTH domain|uniref:helix-turn-helix domain-containing protein n=1 Tax=uncultured Maritimibacter sp. TaxID=991866 RepID=UPI00263094FF|nr:XRE family transcriptional regulator [uncultured Maritimibacter sp.]